MDSSSDLIRSIESFFGVSIGSDAVVLMLTTSVALVVGLLVFAWKKSSGKSKEVKPVVVPKSMPVDVEEEEEVDSGKIKLTIFFGTQTGTAEGFAKVKDLLF